AGEVVIRKGKEQYRALFLESQVMQKKLRQLTRQIISAQEEERKEISRELHDEVVQTLVGINVELSALGRGAVASLHAMKAKIAHTQRLVEHSVSAVHRFARELRPAVLDDLGLIPALHAYRQNLASRKKIKIQMTAFGGVEAVIWIFIFFRDARFWLYAWRAKIRPRSSSTAGRSSRANRCTALTECSTSRLV